MQTPLPPNPTDFIPLMGMLTGVITVVVFGIAVVRIAQSQIGQAIARRIHGKGAQDPELRDEMEELRDQVQRLEQRLAEGEERIDFAERLLASRKESEALPGSARPERL